MIQINLFAKQKQTHRHRKQTGLLKGKGKERINQELKINVKTLPYIKQIK